MSIDHADNGQSQGNIDNPDDIPDNPRGHIGHALAHTNATSPPEDMTSASIHNTLYSQSNKDAVLTDLT